MIFYSAAAQADSAWENDLKRIDELTSIRHKNQPECREMFDLLWSWTKKDNLYASGSLTYAVMPFMHADQILMPGQTETRPSRFYNMLILGNHLFNLKPTDPQERKDLEEIKEAFSFIQDEGFLCVALSNNNEITSDNCTKDPKIVYELPSFESYAASIDENLKNGMEPACREDNHNDLPETVKSSKTPQQKPNP